MTLRLDGLSELETALAALPRATGNAIVRRVLREELEPVARVANSLWPGAADDVFAVSPTLSRGQRAQEEGTSREVVTMHVGARVGRGGYPHAHLVEFGTGPRYHLNGKYVGAAPAQPMLQPAWDSESRDMERDLGAKVMAEIQRVLGR